MKKLYHVLMLLLTILSVSGCRKSSRSTRGSNRKESVKKEERRNIPNRNEREDNGSSHNNDESVDNDDDVNVTPKSVEERRSYWSSNGEENVAMIKQACDYNVPKTKGFANKLAGSAHHSDGTFNIEQISSIYSYCRNKWEYVNDPKGQEYLAKASETIASSLTGDCDDFAVLISSCMLAVGGDVCIVTAFGSRGGHAYAEVDISEMNRSHVIDFIKKTYGSLVSSKPQIREKNGKCWLNLDWQSTYPGGPLYEATMVDYYPCIDGYWSHIK